MMGTASTELKDRINEILAECDRQQRLSQCTQKTREKCLTSDRILTRFTRLIEDLCADDLAKTAPEQRSKFVSQTKKWMETFQALLLEDYKELVERINALNRVTRSFDAHHDNINSSVTRFLQSRSSGEPETLDSLFEKLKLSLHGYRNKKNKILMKYFSAEEKTTDLTRLENRPQIPPRNASNANGVNSREQNENIRESEPRPRTSGYVLPSRSIEPHDIGVCRKRRNYETVDTEENAPPKAHKTVAKESIPEGRNIDDNDQIPNAGSSNRANGSTRPYERAETTRTYEAGSAFVEYSTRCISISRKRKKYEKVDTERNAPPKVRKAVTKASIRDGRNIDEIPNVGNIGSPNRANCSTRVHKRDEMTKTHQDAGSAFPDCSTRHDREDQAHLTSDERDVTLPNNDCHDRDDAGEIPNHGNVGSSEAPEPEVIIIDDDNDDCGGTVNNNKGIDEDCENPPHEVTSFEGITYASVEGCPNIDRRDHDALHNPKGQYTGNIMNRYMFLAMQKLEHRENLRKQHCDALITDEAFYKGIVKPMKPSEQWFIQILYQRKRDHWILCSGERNDACFDIRIYDCRKRSYTLTKNNRKFLERLCGTRNLNVTKSQSIDFQPKGHNDSGLYVLAYVTSFTIDETPVAHSILENFSVVRELIAKTMIEMTFIPTLIICAPPLYPCDEADFCQFEHFVSDLGAFVSARGDLPRVTISHATFSNDRVTKEYLYPKGDSRYASILFHPPTGTYFLITNIEVFHGSKQAYIYEVDPDKIVVGLTNMMKLPSADSLRPKVASLMPSYSSKSIPNQTRLDERKLTKVDENDDSHLSGIESHAQKWDDSQTALQKKVNSLMLCAIKVLELSQHIRPAEFDVRFLESEFENYIDQLSKRYARRVNGDNATNTL